MKCILNIFWILQNFQLLYIFYVLMHLLCNFHFIIYHLFCFFKSVYSFLNVFIYVLNGSAIFTMIN